MGKRKESNFLSFLTTSKFQYSFLFVVSLLLIFLPLYNRDIFTEFKDFGLFGIFILNFLGSATLFFFSTPAIVSTGLGGNLYNPLLVAVLATIGSALGEGITYLFGHTSGHILGIKKHKFLYFFVTFIFTKYGAFVIILFSVIPNPFFDGIGILAGLTGVSLKRFLVYVAIGRFIRNLAISYFGYSI